MRVSFWYSCILGALMKSITKGAHHFGNYPIHAREPIDVRCCEAGLLTFINSWIIYSEYKL